MAVDDVEFREFFASQYARLCWLGLLLTGDQAEAEELAQEAMARTWWRWAVHHPNDPVAYARKVLVNRRRSLLRRAGVESRFLARTRMESVPPPGDEQAMVLWQAVQGLPPRQRAVLVLRFHEDLTEAEVARLLGLPLGTVKSLAHRGRALAARGALALVVAVALAAGLPRLLPSRPVVPATPPITGRPLQMPGGGLGRSRAAAIRTRRSAPTGPPSGWRTAAAPSGGDAGRTDGRTCVSRPCWGRTRWRSTRSPGRTTAPRARPVPRPPAGGSCSSTG